ncbi:MAG: nicotinate-nucleotide adenylyltransferase [Hespellia sp.]|nr:nicotinate-nucleotide adenylyltransferase [Hespellia sp.]
MVETGVIHGRFQVLHLKHMEYLLAAKMRCKTLYIGITHPDELYLGGMEADRHGIRKSDNPLTYLERYQMIHDALIDFGVQRNQFEIVPFPISRPDYITQYAPKDATYFMSICDDWGEKKYQIFTDLGLKVEVLWRKTEEERGVTGTQVRAAIASGQDWQSLVPRTVYEYMVRNGIDERVRKLSMLTDMAETE